MKKQNKKAAFTLGDLPNIAIAVLIFAVVLGIGSTVIESVQDNNLPDAFNKSNPGSYDITYNVTHGGLDGLGTMADYQTTIAIVAIAAVVIGIILVFFGRQM